MATQGSGKGVHFHFKDNSKYWTLIRALDICDIENVQTYVPKDNDIWVYHITPRPETPAEKERNKNLVRPICGNSSFYNDIVIEKPYKEIENEKREKINSIIDTAKRFWLSEVLFIAMITLTIIKLGRTLK